MLAHVPMIFVWYRQHFSHNYSWILNAGLGNSKVLILGLLEFSYACCYNYSLLVRFGEVKSYIVIKKWTHCPQLWSMPKQSRMNWLWLPLMQDANSSILCTYHQEKMANSVEVGPTVWTARISRTKRIVEIFSHPLIDQALDYGAIAPLSWNGCTSRFYTSYIRTVFKQILDYIQFVIHKFWLMEYLRNFILRIKVSQSVNWLVTLKWKIHIPIVFLGFKFFLARGQRKFEPS